MENVFINISPDIYCTGNLKGQRHEIFDMWFFYESVSPKPLSIPLGPFWIFCKFAEIFAAQGAPQVWLTPVANGKKHQKEKFGRIFIISKWFSEASRSLFLIFSTKRPSCIVLFGNINAVFRRVISQVEFRKCMFLIFVTVHCICHNKTNNHYLVTRQFVYRCFSKALFFQGAGLMLMNWDASSS